MEYEGAYYGEAITDMVDGSSFSSPRITIRRKRPKLHGKRARKAEQLFRKLMNEDMPPEEAQRLSSKFLLRINKKRFSRIGKNETSGNDS